MAKLSVTMAVGPYEHVRDLATGRVTVEGVDLNFLDLPSLDVFHRMTEHREFDVSEFSFGRYVGMLGRDDESLIALPVFVSRVFRLASIYVREGGPIRNPEDLKGKRIGVPEWPQTAAIYMRGWLQHEVGADLGAVGWVVGGLNGPNPQAASVPQAPGLHITAVADQGLNQMLLDGGIDALFSASAPHGYMAAQRRIVRLFPDYLAEEQAYYRKTGIFPIMHIICMRRELAQHHPWLPMNLLKAFEKAKNNSLDAFRFDSMSRYALPWANAYVERSRSIFGHDFWPYGVAANERTLEAFVQYAYEQGVCRRRVSVAELFPESARDTGTFYSAQGEPEG